jgi:light-regulated signal transduction histidine kinase (bacteriophytochrome)
MGQWVKYELERQQYERDLEDTVDQLQQSNDRLKQFAYAASHDLQEPLRMVSSYLQLLEDRYRDDLDEEAQEFIDFAVDGADRMRAMVDDLLAYSRVEQSDGEFDSVDCDALLERVTDDLQVQIAENDAEIVADSLPTVTADSEQLEQLFSNLVSNAIKYSGDDPPRIEISADRRGDYWEISVDDNGIGMDPEKTDRIFEVFKRLHHDDEYPGTGIGLSLCQEIVENHGGDIWAESEPGEGSTFRFTLPGLETER